VPRLGDDAKQNDGYNLPHKLSKLVVFILRVSHIPQDLMHTVSTNLLNDGWLGFWLFGKELCGGAWLLIVEPAKPGICAWLLEIISILLKEASLLLPVPILCSHQCRRRRRKYSNNVVGTCRSGERVVVVIENGGGFLQRPGM
jgi:hypothetical protein